MRLVRTLVFRLSTTRVAQCAAIFALAVVTACAVTGCSEAGPGGPTMQAHLQRISTSGTGASGNRLVRFSVNPGTPSAPHWSSAVTLTSFKVPVFRISVSATNGQSVSLYSCDAQTNDGCLVELTGGALQDLITTHPVSVPQGTYDHVTIETCASSSYTGYVTGTVSLNGTTYYTDQSGTLSTTGPATPLPLQYSGCGRYYTLPTPVAVIDTAGATIPFTMYFDIRDVAWAAVGGSDVSGAWLPGGCSGQRPTDAAPQAFICTGYPDVAGLPGAVPPTLERYRINGGATLGLFFTAGTDLPVGGFTRRYFTEGDPTTAGFSADTPVDTLAKNGDGTLHIATFGGGSSGSSLSAPYFAVQSFQRADHSGAFTAVGVPGTYTAVRLSDSAP